MMYTKIKPPKFRIGRYVLNEYELRTLMADIAEGKMKGNIKVKEIGHNEIATIWDSGRLSHSLPGLKIAANATLRAIKAYRNQ